MDYSVYNDYELLYLIYDGVEPALKLLYSKYNHLIYRTAIAFYSGDKVYDLIQEGRMILQQCIYSYRPNRGASFYSYFLLAYKRKIIKLLNGEYFKEYNQLEDNLYSAPDYSNGFMYTPENLFKDESDRRIYQEIIIDGISIRAYANKYSLSYMKVYRRYLEIVDELKKWVTK